MRLFYKCTPLLECLDPPLISASSTYSVGCIDNHLLLLTCTLQGKEVQIITCTPTLTCTCTCTCTWCIWVVKDPTETSGRT